MIQKTLSIIKPDAVERNLTENIKTLFKNNKFNIVREKKIQVSKDEAAEFYKVHQTKPFYDRLCEYLSSGIIVVMILNVKIVLKYTEKQWVALILKRKKEQLEKNTEYLLIKIQSTVQTH